MKKSLLILTMCMAISISTFAQFNYFFPDSNSYFSVSYMKFWFQGDTVIENLKYKKVYVQYEDSIANFNNASYFAAIREDTTAKKVYGVASYTSIPYCPYNGEEVLLYDFSVNVGDIVSFYSFWPFGEPHIREQQVVKSIDSILVDNHYRKRINFIHNEGSWNAYPESWIEGIGSTHGLFFAGIFDVIDVMNWTTLLCVHIDGRLIYQYLDPFYDNYSCYIPKSGVNIIENKNEILKIYPTIVDNLLNIKTDVSTQNFNYKIINVQGQVINSEMLTSSTINVSNLNKGFYFIVISDNKNGKNIKTQKILKH